MLQQKHLDFVSQVLDEIVIEGLDGITLASLWVRLEDKSSFNIALDDNSKSYIWRMISIHPDVEFYELPAPRIPVTLFNRYEHRDPESGMCLEISKKDAPPEVYPVKIIDDKCNRGSCATFTQRTDVTNIIRSNNSMLISYDDVLQKYGDTLAIVAAQHLRTCFLFGESCDPQLEITNIQYVMLELVARSRYHGLVTTGQVCSFAGLNETPKSLFYHRRLLISKQLLKRQLHFQKAKSATQWGFVFHHPQFYIDRPTTIHLMLQRLCNTLENKPKKREIYVTLRNETAIPDTTLKRILARGQPLAQFTDVSSMPLAEFNGEETDTSGGKTVKRRLQKVITLVKSFSWNSLVEAVDERDEEDYDDTGANGSGKGDIDMGRLVKIRPIICQAYDLLYKHSPEGMSEREIQYALGITKLDSRSICRYLTRASVVSTYRKDMGRQRVTMYVIAEHLHMSQAHQSILEERQKMLESDNTEERSFVEAVQAAEASAQDDDSLQNGTVSHINVSQDDSLVSSGILEQDSSLLLNTSKTSLLDVSPSKKSESDAGIDLNDKNLTSRQLSRANFILDMVRKQVFIDDAFKIQRALIAKEANEGLSTKLAKRSVLTLIDKLVKDGYIKSINTTLKIGDTSKKLHFVCLPEINQSHPLVQSAIQSAKMRMVDLKYTESKKIYKTVRKPKNEQDEAAESQEKHNEDDGHKAEWQTKVADMVLKNSGDKCGFLPKFCRANVLHELIFYLSYDYQGKYVEQTEDIMTKDVMIINDDYDQPLNKQPQQYCDNKDWKMFIPPLPQMEGYPGGWCLVHEILLRLPLSIFMQIINTPFNIEGLDEYLNDPVKKHYLIDQLPIRLRNSLLMSRRYIFHINDILVLLCHMGLVTFGPQVHKDKDQTYIYVHRIASVMDTTISDPGHNTVSPDEDYSWRFHLLNTVGDVQNYWSDMKTVCLNTPLGKKFQEKEPVIEKPEMMKALLNRTVEEVVDEGRVPGDHLGAGGLDSGLCSFLKRNWAASQASASKSTPKSQKKKKQEAIPKIDQVLNQSYNVHVMDKMQNKQENTTVASSSGSQPQNLNIGVSIEKNYSGSKNAPKFSIFPDKVKKREKVVKQGKQLKSTASGGKKALDFKDQLALDLMQKQRSTFSSQDDTFFLIVKVASVLMGTKHLAVTSVLLRDEHEKHCPREGLKTSKACLRRYNVLCRRENLKDTQAIMLLETQQNQKLQRMINTPSYIQGSQQWNDKFQSILKELIWIFNDKNVTSSIGLPDTMAELNQNYTVTVVSKTSTDPAKYESHFNPENINDVYYNVLFNIMMVSVSCLDTHTNWSYHLYRIYHQFPEDLIKAVIKQMRDDRIISMPKFSQLKKVPEMAYSAHPYRLSMSYKNSLITRYQTEIFDDANDLLELLLSTAQSDSPFLAVAPNTCEGYGMTMQALLASKAVILRTEIPEQILDVKNISETVTDKVAHQLKQLDQGSQDENSQVSIKSGQSEGAQNLPASRLGLHLLRKQIFTAPSLKNTVHSSDLFVVKSCDVYCRLKVQNTAQLNENVVKQWMKSQVVKSPDHQSVLQLCFQANIVGDEQRKIVTVYETIQSKESLGISHEELSDIAGDMSIAGFELTGLLKVLRSNNMIVRVGVRSYIYVTTEYADPWLMKTIIIPKDKKAAAKIPYKADSIDDGSDHDDIPAENEEDNEEEDDDVMMITDQPSSSKLSDQSSQPSSSKSVDQPAAKRRRIDLKAPLSEFMPSFSEDECTKVNVVCRPWYKPDGFINRKILFSMIESVACYIAQNPGISETNLMNHYSPFVQPVAILDIIEMLLECDCIKKISVKKHLNKSGPFFSCSYLSTREEIVDKSFLAFYEPEVDILLKVSRIKKFCKAKEWG